MFEKVNGQNNLQALYRFSSLTMYNLLWLRTRGNQFCSYLYILNPLFPRPWQFLKFLRVSSIELLLCVSCKRNVSHTNIPSQQIVCTSGPSTVHLSLTFTSFSFKRLLSFPHAPSAIYQKHSALIWKSSRLHSQSHCTFPLTGTDKTCATTSSKTCSSKIRDNSRESSLQFHFTS